MEAKHYHVGLVMSQVGITEPQHCEINDRVKIIRKGIDANAKIVFWIACFEHDPEVLWPYALKWFHKLVGVNVEFLPGNPTVLQLYHEMREYDEVWCLPAKGQARLTRCRVSQLYYMSQEPENVTTARVFKWIPYWMGANKPMKGKS